jgi:hypothetical protein
VELTAGANWKDPEIRSQNCVCEDERNGLFEAATDQGRKAIMDEMDHLGCFGYANKLMGQPTSRKNVPPPK